MYRTGASSRTVPKQSIEQLSFVFIIVLSFTAHNLFVYLGVLRLLEKINLAASHYNDERNKQMQRSAAYKQCCCINTACVVLPYSRACLYI